MTPQWRAKMKRGGLVVAIENDSRRMVKERREERRLGSEVGWRAGGRVGGLEVGEQSTGGDQRTVEQRKMKCVGLITSSGVRQRQMCRSEAAGGTPALLLLQLQSKKLRKVVHQIQI